MGRQVPFAQETVFSYWEPQQDGKIRSKVDLIHKLQQNHYFVLLIFVGLRDAQLSIARVSSRKAAGGHDVAIDRLLARFERTQRAVSHAVNIADASILVDNSRRPDQAFTVARIQAKTQVIYDIRNGSAIVPTEIAAWLNVVSPIR
jgi:predicted ABC-type ATPase